MKFLKSLPARLLLGIVLGGYLATLVLPEKAMVAVATIKYILNQFINFCVPLIIIGFIAPSITKLGSNATRMLMVALAAAYLSSLLAGLVSAPRWPGRESCSRQTARAAAPPAGVPDHKSPASARRRPDTSPFPGEPYAA